MKPVVLLILAVAAGLAAAQPQGSNPGLPPSARATGLAPQLIQGLAIEQIQAQNRYSSEDLLAFLVNTECLEARFDSFAAFGVDMDPALVAGGGAARGGKKANLSSTIQQWAEEVARDEVGHVRILREALGPNAPPCPEVDINNAFQAFFRRAFGDDNLQWDPYADDLHFVLSMFALEEVGATGDQGVTGFAAYNLANGLGNLTHVAIAGGLAGSAWAQSAADRFILWERRGETIPGTSLTVNDAFTKLSALRQDLTGSVRIDQPLTFQGGINIVPTDGNGVTLARTPQQVLNIVTLGQGGQGGFLPSGPNGRIKTTSPLNPTVPSALLQAANADYVVVQGQPEAEPLLPPVAATTGRR